MSCTTCGRTYCDGHDTKLPKLHVDGTIVAANRTVELREALRRHIAAVVEQNQKMQACIVYARDRRGSGVFDFDEWISMVGHALDNQIPPSALENAQAKEQIAWQAAERIRTDRDLWKTRATTEWSKGPYGGVDDPGAARVAAKERADLERERTKDLHVMTAQGKAIEELREKLHDTEKRRAVDINTMYNQRVEIDALREDLRVAEAVRDDARRASQRYLDGKREVEDHLRKVVIDWRLEVDRLEAEKREACLIARQAAEDADEAPMWRLDELQAKHGKHAICTVPGCPGVDGEGCLHTSGAV